MSDSSNGWCPPSYQPFDDEEETFTYRSAAASWLLRGAALSGLALLPLGPLGFLAGLFTGGVLAIVGGLIVDSVRFNVNRKEVTRQERKFEQLLRWAEFTFSDADSPTDITFYLLQQFETIVECGSRKVVGPLNRRLRDFLERNDVQACLSDYVACFFAKWREADALEIATFDLVTTVCANVFANQRRPPAVYEKMIAFRNHKSVQKLLDKATLERKSLRQKNLRHHHWLPYTNLENKKVDALFRQDLADKFMFGTKIQADAFLRSQESGQLQERKLSRGDSMLVLPDSIPHPYLRDFASPPSASREKGESASRREGQSPTAIASDQLYDLDVSCVVLGDVGSGDSGHYRVVIDEEERKSGGSDADSSEAYKRSSASCSDGSEMIEVAPAVGIAKSSPVLSQESISLRRDATYEPVDGKEQINAASCPLGEQARAESKNSKSSALAHQRSNEKKVVSSKSGSQKRLVRKETSGEKKRGQVTSPRAKKFFKNLEDLRNFSPHLKHKVPIGLNEFSFLDELAPEHPLGAWEHVMSRNDVRIYKQIVSVAGSDLVMVKGYCVMRGIPADVVLFNIKDTARRTAWDSVFAGFVLVESNIQGNEIVYNFLKAPWPVASRDFLQWRRTLIEPETGVVKIFHRSAEHPAYPEPKSTSVIRAESIISAYIISPRGPEECDLFLVTQTDIKGIVPRWVVNSQAAKAPIGWVESLRKACFDTMKSNQCIPSYMPTKESV